MRGSSKLDYGLGAERVRLMDYGVVRDGKKMVLISINGQICIWRSIMDYRVMIVMLGV